MDFHKYIEFIISVSTLVTWFRVSPHVCWAWKYHWERNLANLFPLAAHQRPALRQKCHLWAALWMGRRAACVPLCVFKAILNQLHCLIADLWQAWSRNKWVGLGSSPGFLSGGSVDMIQRTYTARWISQLYVCGTGQMNIPNPNMTRF